MVFFSFSLYIHRQSELVRLTLNERTVENSSKFVVNGIFLIFYLSENFYL